MQILKNRLTLLKQHYHLFGMLLLSIIVLHPVLSNGWVYWDDPAYVLNNEFLIISSLDDVVNMFSLQIVQGNYHPLTILSLALDYSIDGANPLVFHSTNLLFHLANSVLVYIFTFKLFQQKFSAFLVSCLFTIHPMHVESFAWVSERKDVLYVFFFLLGLIQYLAYQEKQNYRTYFLCLFLFLMSLLSKGMAVVFPIVLLLLDYLNRRKLSRKLILEKLPFFVLSLVFGLIVLWAQKKSMAISSNDAHPMSQAILIPIHGFILYVIEAFIPFKLSALHPYPKITDGNIPPIILFSFVPLLALIIGLVKFYRNDRKVIFGFAFFLFVIFPVLQFISVGSAMISERYTYLSYIGLFIVLGVVLEEAYSKGSPLRKQLILMLTGIYISILSFQTYQRTHVWKNDESLWSDVIASYPDDYFGYMKRGSFRAKNGDLNNALIDLNKGISIFQNDYYLFNNRGMVYMSQQKYDLAEKDFSKAIEIDSTLYEANLNRGLIYLNTQDYNKALLDFKKAEILAPENGLVYVNQALLFERIDSVKLAIASYEKALDLDPANFQIYGYRASFFFKLGQINLALMNYEKAIQLNPQYAEAYYWKARTLLELDKKSEALLAIRKARQLGYSISNEEFALYVN